MKKIIVILNSIIITNSTFQLTACKHQTPIIIKGIELNKITLGMFFDPSLSYHGEDENGKRLTVKGEKIAILQDKWIKRKLDHGLKVLFKEKLTGIERNKKNSDMTEKEKDILEIYKCLTYFLVEENGLSSHKSFLDIKIIPQGDKRFEIDIFIKKWSDIEKAIKNQTNKTNEKIKLESVKAMYKLVKGEKAIIVVDFSSSK